MTSRVEVTPVSTWTVAASAAASSCSSDMWRRWDVTWLTVQFDFDLMLCCATMASAGTDPRTSPKHVIPRSKSEVTEAYSCSAWHEDADDYDVDSNDAKLPAFDWQFMIIHHSFQHRKGNLLSQLSTRKQSKAQHIACPACANSTVYFLLTYRLAMLVPPSEWLLKPIAVRIFAYVHPYTPSKVTKRYLGLLDQSLRIFYQTQTDERWC